MADITNEIIAQFRKAHREQKPAFVVSQKDKENPAMNLSVVERKLDYLRWAWNMYDLSKHSPTLKEWFVEDAKKWKHMAA